MRRLKLTGERRERFLSALAKTGIVSTAVEIAGTSRTRVYELRKRDAGFSSAWDEAEEQAADALEAEAWRRAVTGVAEPLVSIGKDTEHLGHPRARIRPRFRPIVAEAGFWYVRARPS